MTTSQISHCRAYAKGYISIEKLRKLLAATGFILTEAYENWIKTEAGKEKTIYQYEKMIKENEEKAKALRASQQYDKNAQKFD